MDKALLSKIPSPCFVIEEGKLIKNLELLQEVKQRAGVSILLAQKAYSNWFTYPLIGEYLDGASASSIYEARLAFEEMQKPVHSYSPAYRKDEINDYLKYSSHIIYNSLSQYKFFLDTIKSNQDTHHFGLRVNPGYSEIEIDIYNPVLPGSRFGINAKDLPSIPEGITGLHFHALCENNSFTLEKTLASFEKLFSHVLSDISYVNMGGGHFITDTEYDVDHLVKVLTAFKTRHPHLDIILEPGAAVVLNTGFLLTTVVDIIDHGDVKIAMIDASFTAHMPDCLEMPYLPEIIGAKAGTQGDNIYKIGGNTCLSGDFISEYSFDKKLSIGSEIIFLDQIQYSMVKTSQFNGIPHPGIGYIDKQNKFKLVRSFVYDDFKGRLG